jgi:type I restriction-modification system DNA methylase subunit
MGYSKRQYKLHQLAMTLLDKETLTQDERETVFQNFLPGFGNDMRSSGAFFTPHLLASSLACCTPSDEAKQTTIVDIAAGIGRLARSILDHHAYGGHPPHLTCIERNPTFVAVGKRLVPEATWLSEDIFSQRLWTSLPRFDFGVANPPFGQPLTGSDKSWFSYKGSAELMVVELILRFCNDGGTVILPKTSVPFRASGEWFHEELTDLPEALQKFFACHPTALLTWTSMDCSLAECQWQGTKAEVEMAYVGYRDEATRPFSFTSSSLPKKAEAQPLFEIGEL